MSRKYGIVALAALALSAITWNSASAQVRINELDADQTGTDSTEFVELYDGGVGNTSLDNMVLVFFNGVGDISYAAFDLDGKSTDANGYFLAGSQTLITMPGNNNIVIGNTNALQNGPDAVALYSGNFTSPGAATATNLLDAVVYGTSDIFTGIMLDEILLLAGEPPVDEDGGTAGAAVTLSIGRCPNGAGGLRRTFNYRTGMPTPGMPNDCPMDPLGACCLAMGLCQIETSADCTTLGGNYQGDAVACNPNPCMQNPGACCDAMGNCSFITLDNCTAASGVFQGEGVPCTPNPCKGACCDTMGMCTLQTASECASASGIYKGDGTDCTNNPCVGACCEGGGMTCSIRTEADCEQNLLGIYLGDATTCAGACPPDYSGLLINEIRQEMSGSDVDEYFEIVNTSASPRSLNGLTYIVIGDEGTFTNPMTATNSGLVQLVVDLSGHPPIPAGGHFLAARPTLNTTFFPVTPDLLVLGTVQEGPGEIFHCFSDNTTHMLVSGFRGDVATDIDADDNCMIDAPAWITILDKIALIEADNPGGMEPVGTECHYGTGDPFIDTLRDGAFNPGHVFRLPDGSNTGFEDWRVGPFAVASGDDTPGSTNMLSTGACCVGVGGCTDAVERQVCVEAQGGTWLGRGTTCAINGASCMGACCVCMDPPGCTMFDCSVVDSSTCASMNGVYQGALTTCSVPPSPGACAECKTIAEARALPAGTPIRLCNVVLSSKTNLINTVSSKSFQIQDTSGVDGQSGLTVFGPTALIDGQFGGVTEGNQIDIQGTTGVFNSLIQLQTAPAKLLQLSRDDGPSGVPAAVGVTSADFQTASPTAEGFESEIVQLPCVVFQQTGVFAGATNYTVSDGAGMVTVRVSTTFQTDIVGQPIPSGPVTLTGIFSQLDGSAAGNSGYQLQLRKITDINTSPSCGTPAACCLAGATCRADLPEALCNGLGGIFHAGQPTCPPTPACPDNLDTRITEIRIDQPGVDDDEYFELTGTPNAPIGDLTYLVIGDGADLDSGVIEAAVSLAGQQIPADGVFLAAESTFGLIASVDFTTTLNFENDDNVTHLLVKGFTGAVNNDLDTDNDGVLDSTPWTVLLDKVALISEQNPPVGTEFHYGPPIVGPSGGTSPGHVALCPTIPPEWRIGAFDPDSGDDTPGEPNPQTCSCAGCLGDMDVNGTLNGLDVQGFAAALVGMTGNGCADINQDAVVDTNDILPFVDRIIAAPPCGLARAFGTRIVTWNLLAYNGGASSNRKTAYKRVLNHLNADVVIAEEVEGAAGASDFLTTILNANDGPGGYSMAEFTNGPDSDNALYYRADKIVYTNGNHTTLATTPRIIDRWRLDHVGSPAGGVFYVYAMHLKAGSAMVDPQNPVDRQAAAAVARADANALPAGTQIIYAGDLNLYTSTEGAYTELTGSQGDNDGRCFDPISAPGAWSASAGFSAVHTQSPHNDNAGSPPGGSNGGLDDRFDFLLISDSLRDGVGLSYITNSYRAFGNDGNHFNADINDPPTIPQGLFIADALHAASDHLPVYMELGLFVGP
ncbi:MAG: hypothetical protein B6D36_05005 [Planctomycetes bacterium UTPLA1]|nr:MAG: hypothetical protein B6D36_05005 [Planctomycetes bacterium UTPLA1]